MFQRKTVLSAAIVAACASPSLLAQEDIEETVVTATRTEQKLADSLVSATVISAAEIERFQSSDLEDVLRRVPGLDLTRNGGRGSAATVRLRGTSGDQVLVLIDGVRSASATNGSTALAHIPVSTIDRIEIVRGPVSGLYGADAIGGVIQVFTKQAKEGDNAFNPTIGYETGSYGSKKTTAGVSGALGGTRYSLNVGYESADGIDRTVGVAGDEDGYREQSVSARVDHYFDNDAVLGARYLRSEGNTEVDGSVTSTDFLNENIGLNGQLPLTESLTVSAHVGQYLDQRESFGTFPSLFETKRFSADVQLEYQLDEQQTIIAGYDYYDDEVNSTSNFSESSRDNAAYFAQYLADFDVYHLQANIRRDDNEAYGENTTGTIALGVDITDDVLLSLSYGEAFKAPTFNSLFFPYTDYGFGFIYVGNADLAPEESDSYELLLRGKSGQVDWSFSYYETKISNLIDTFAFDATLGAFTALNIDEASIKGSEVTAAFEVFGLVTDIALSYTDPVDDSTGDVLNRHARTKATINLNKNFGQFDVDLAWLAQGKRFDGTTELSGYNLVDFFLSYRVTNELVVSANVKNLFDTDYTLLDGFSTEGRTYTASVRYSF